MSRQGHEIIVLGKTKDHLTRIKEIKEDKIGHIAYNLNTFNPALIFLFNSARDLILKSFFIM